MDSLPVEGTRLSVKICLYVEINLWLVVRETVRTLVKGTVSYMQYHSSTRIIRTIYILFQWYFSRFRLSMKMVMVEFPNTRLLVLTDWLDLIQQDRKSTQLLENMMKMVTNFYALLYQPLFYYNRIHKWGFLYNTCAAQLYRQLVWSPRSGLVIVLFSDCCK